MLLFYDNIYLLQLTGTSRDGEEITLSVCPEVPDHDDMFLDPDKVRDNPECFSNDSCEE